MQKIRFGPYMLYWPQESVHRSDTGLLVLYQTLSQMQKRFSLGLIVFYVLYAAIGC